jgi:hypothetical protein
MKEVRYVKYVKPVGKGEILDGVSFEDIQKELPALTATTFRKWRQDGLLPDPVGYKITPKGRITLYPTSIIEFLKEHTVIAIRWKK